MSTTRTADNHLRRSFVQTVHHPDDCETCQDNLDNAEAHALATGSRSASYGTAEHKATWSVNVARAERARMVVQGYGADATLADLLTDLAAYAETLGPDAFANAAHAATERVARARLS